MRSLEDEIRKLSKINKDLLMLAFEQGIDRWVIVRDDIFVGVHLINDSKLDVAESKGAWSCGRLKAS